MREPIQIFIAYSRKDTPFLEELRTHLNPLERTQRVTIWYDGKIEPGSVWEDDIKAHLHDSDIILLLVSADAISSDYFYEKEVTDALERHHAGKARVIPLILRPCAWQATPLGRLQALPRDGQAVSTWADHDQAFADAISTLWQVIEQITSAPETVRDHTLIQSAPLYPNPAMGQPMTGRVTAKPGSKSGWQMGGRSLKEWLWSPLGVVLVIAVFVLGILNADRIRGFYFNQRYYVAELELSDVDEPPYLNICEDSPPPERFICTSDAIRERVANIPEHENPYHGTEEMMEFEVIYMIWWDGEVSEEMIPEDIGPCGMLVMDHLFSWPVSWVPARKEGKKTACRVHLHFRCTPDGVELL